MNSSILPDAIVSVDATESRTHLEQELASRRRQLKSLAENSSALERAKINLEITKLLLALDRKQESWNQAHPLVSIFIEHENFQHAVETYQVLYLAEQAASIAALGQGCWLAVTYPIDPALSAQMLHYVVDETPDRSDGAAVASMAAHYITDLRSAGENRENLLFTTMQKLTNVAKRHRNIENEEALKIWIEIFELNDTGKLFSRLAKMIDVVVGSEWWFDRDYLRSRLPVN